MQLALSFAPIAVEHVMKMKGGSQARLIRCNDSAHYVTKFAGNPQHTRVLANEMIAYRLAKLIGVAVPKIDTIEVTSQFIRENGITFDQAGGTFPVDDGIACGSMFPGDPKHTPVFEWIPNDQLFAAHIRRAFCSALVLDKWLCNTDGRQVIFHREPGEYETMKEGEYNAQFIDNGFCLNAGEWNFPDASLRGLYLNRLVYSEVTGLESFDPWLSKAMSLTHSDIERAIGDTPEAWWFQQGDRDLGYLISVLYNRLQLLPGLLIDARDCCVKPFPKWTN